MNATELNELIEKEISWCIGDGKGLINKPEFEDGFIAGLRQAQILMCIEKNGDIPEELK